jgi:hypothetical protein
VLDGLTTAERAFLSGLVAKSLRGREIPSDAEERRKFAENAHARARTAVKKENDKIKREKLRGEDRKKAVAERVGPLENVSKIRRSEWLVALKNAVQSPELSLGARIDCTAEEYRNHAKEFAEVADGASRQAIRYFAAFGSDACVEDGKGDPQGRKINATPFCFIRGSGNQNFLDTVRKLLTEVSVNRVAETLFEPWTYRDQKLSMRWDPGEDKRYALTDIKPADEGALTVWMANLLAYRSLALFSCAPTSRGLGTTAWAEVEDELAFTWPLWDFPASPDLVCTLLRLREMREAKLDRVALSGRGITAVFRARRIRVGKYLNFSPARGLL